MQGYWDALRVQATPGAQPWLCVQTPSNPGPLPKASSFAACSLGLDGAVSISLAYQRLMRRCKCGAPCRSCGSSGLLAEDGMRSSPQNDVSCPREIHNPGKRRRGAVAQQFGLNPSGPQGRRVYLSFVEQAEEMHGRANDQRYGLRRQRTTATRHSQASALCDVVRTHLAHPHGIGIDPSIIISSVARRRPVIKEPPERTAMLPTAEPPNSSSRPFPLRRG